jgi:hypothetical protein
LNAALVAIHCHRVQERRNLSEWCEAGLADVVGDAVVVEGEVALVRMVPETAWSPHAYFPHAIIAKREPQNIVMILYAARFAKSGRMIMSSLVLVLQNSFFRDACPYARKPTIALAAYGIIQSHTPLQKADAYYSSLCA